MRCLGPYLRLRRSLPGVIALPLLVAACSYGITQEAGNLSPGPVSHAEFGKLPLCFEINRGQADSGIQFIARGDGYMLSLIDGGAVLQSRTGTMQMSLVGSVRTSSSVPSTGQPVGEQLLPGRINYFLGNDPEEWKTDLPTYAKVRYPHVYPGIDLVYYGNQRQLEYDFIVAPGANAAVIQMRFDGKKAMHVDSKGDLVLEEANGSATLHKPVVYQVKGGERRSVAGAFEISRTGTVSFRLGGYDHDAQLVIDPVLVYSTYLGGSGMSDQIGNHNGDQGNGIAVDASGSAYVVGRTFSADFPVTGGAFQKKNKALGDTVFVSKLNPQGTALVYSTYLGGSGLYSGGNLGSGDGGYAIALDAGGNAYLTGYTYSADFPVTSGAYSKTIVSQFQNVFVTKLNAAGNALVYSTLIGAGIGQGIAVDAAGDAYVTGNTGSTQYPTTPGALQPYNAGQALFLNFSTSNAFVTKLKADGSGLDFSTYLGGSGIKIPNNDSNGDGATAIAVDSAGNSYVTGYTNSANFPITSGAFQTSYPGKQNTPYPELSISNAFVSKLNADGTALVYSTYLGGTGYLSYATGYLSGVGDQANSIALDSLGNAYVGGTTASLDFPVVTGGLSIAGDNAGAGFVSKLNAAGSALELSTYVGGGGTSVNALQLDSNQNIYLAGTAGTGFPQTADAVPSQSCCVFVSKLNADAAALEYSTLLGSTATSTAAALAVDSLGATYVTGSTNSAMFPVTAGAAQTTYKVAANATTNAFVSKLALANETTDLYGSATKFTVSQSVIHQGQATTLSVKVTGATGSAVPQGTVTISALSDSVAFTAITVPLNSSGMATWSSSTLSNGLYSLKASYSGDSTHLASSQSLDPALSVLGVPAMVWFESLGDGGQTTYGIPFSGGFYVFVQDSQQQYLPGVTVNLSGAGLSFSQASLVTNQDGYATGYPIASRAGSLTVQATVSGTSVSGTLGLRVLPAPLTVALQTGRRLYGAPNPTFAYKVSGLVGSDTVTVTPQTSAVATTPVGIYPLTAAISGPLASNYTPTVLATASLVIYQAPLYITALGYRSVYGTTPPQPTQYRLNGFQNGETGSVVSGAPILTTTVTATTPAGLSLIGVGVGTLSARNYYFSTFSNGYGHVQVVKAPLLVTANNLTMHEGGVVPTLTYTVTGFVNGDTYASSVTGVPALTTTATSSSRPGKYPIVASRGSTNSNNYGLWNYANGVLTVLP